MHCPLCGTFLRAIDYEGVRIHTCDACGGELIGSDQLRQIVIQREMRFSPDLQAALESHRPAFGVPERDGRRSFTCPSCAGPMQVVNYGGDSGVHVDRCEECGSMYLDREELERIQVIMEQWEDDAPEQIRAIAHELEETRREAAESTSRAFAASRFAFVNALINRFLDAA